MTKSPSSVRIETSVPETPSTVPVIGRGATLYAEALGLGEVDVPEYPSAEVLAFGVATGTLPVVAPDPLYLRRPDVTLAAGGPKSVLPK